VPNRTLDTRFILREVSTDLYTYSFEISEDGGKSWNEIMEGKANREK
jgi:hypothetical protein